MCFVLADDEMTQTVVFGDVQIVPDVQKNNLEHHNLDACSIVNFSS